MFIVKLLVMIRENFITCYEANRSYRIGITEITSRKQKRDIVYKCETFLPGKSCERSLRNIASIDLIRTRVLSDEHFTVF